jgi:small subunit ribosomal protein S10
MSISSPQIRILLTSFDHRLIDQTVKKIVDSLKRTGAVLAGPVPLPTQKQKHTILTSPNGDKDARDQFEIRTHRRLIVIRSATDKTTDALKRLDDLPAEVDIELKMGDE